MQPNRLIFLGTTEFSLLCLKTLYESRFYKIVGVITKEDRPRGRRGLKDLPTPVKVFCQKEGLAIWTLETFLAQKQTPPCDFALAVAYGHILPESFLKAFPKGVFNIHPSLLPRWRGAAPIERALMAGDQNTGVCLQLMTKELDAGDIVEVYEFPIKEEDNAHQICKKTEELSKILLLKDLPLFLEGKKKAKSQSEAGMSPIYAKKINKTECEISWQEPASVIHNKIRALYLGPQAFTFFKAERLKIYRSRRADNPENSLPPGSLLCCKGDAIVVACGVGALELLEIQRSGKKRQTTREFLKGTIFKKGDRFK